MSEQRMKTVTAVSTHEGWIDWPPKEAGAALAWFQAKLAEVPVDYIASARLEIGHLEETGAFISITYERPETDAEREMREAYANASAQELERQELAQLRALLKKYGMSDGNESRVETLIRFQRFLHEQERNAQPPQPSDGAADTETRVHRAEILDADDEILASVDTTFGVVRNAAGVVVRIRSRPAIMVPIQRTGRATRIRVDTPEVGAVFCGMSPTNLTADGTVDIPSYTIDLKPRVMEPAGFVH